MHLFRPYFILFFTLGSLQAELLTTKSLTATAQQDPSLDYLDAFHKENNEQSHTAQLYKAIKEKEALNVEHILATNRADINARLPEFNNLTPFEFALQETIKEAQRYKYRYALNPCHFPIISLVVAALTTYGCYTEASKLPCYSSLSAAAVTGGFGLITYAQVNYIIKSFNGFWWDNLHNQLCILQLLLNNATLDLTQTTLDLTNSATQELFAALRNYTCAPDALIGQPSSFKISKLNNFVQEVIDGKYTYLAQKYAVKSV